MFKVETVGHVYMAVSGAPEPSPHHAINVADVALKLLQRMPNLKIPSGILVQIRIGNLVMLYLIQIIFSNYLFLFVT